MAQRRSYQPPRRKSSSRTPPPLQAAPVRSYVKAAPIEYGKPFVLLEDERKNTFEYQGGAWVAYPRSIADCKVDCQVKELAQKVNKMTRYEVRLPLPASE